MSLRLVARRLDALLEPTKAEVLKRQEALREKRLSVEQIETVLITGKVSGHPFVNTSPFTLRTLRDHQTQLRANFEAYLKGLRTGSSPAMRSSSSLPTCACPSSGR